MTDLGADLYGSDQAPQNVDLGADLYGNDVGKDSLLSSAIKPIANIPGDIAKESDEGYDMLTRPFPSPTGSIGGDLLAGGKDTLIRAAGLGKYVTSPISGTVKALASQPASNLAQSYGMSPENAKSYIQDPIDITASVFTPMAAEELAPEVAKVGGSILDRLKNSNFIQDEASLGSPVSLNSAKTIASKVAPSIDPKTAQLVQDASDIGINIPPSIFNPGTTSNALGKVGLMSDNSTKSDITTALSKIMGHEGTPNLDVQTMEDIQKNIGGKMNDFALQADTNGGIPVHSDDLSKIADDSYADAPKVNKLLGKVTAKINDDGTISGQDYISLTKKGGAIDKAMNSSDSDFADTAKELRSHLDNQLESSVDPDDLEAFKDARRQYRTMKIIQPIVESGGVTGQADSASKLFNAVKNDYGSMSNALKYNPQLGKIAQIANEFPEALKDVPTTSIASKIAQASFIPSALGIGSVGGVPLGATALATAPIAKGVGSYLSSPFYKQAIIDKSLPKLLPEIEEQIPNITSKSPLFLPAATRPNITTSFGDTRPMSDAEWQSHIDKNNEANQIGLTPDVRKAQDTNATNDMWNSIAAQKQAALDAEIDAMWKNKKTSLKDVVSEHRRNAQDLADATGDQSPSTYLSDKLNEAFDKEGYAKGGIVAKRKALLHEKHRSDLSAKLAREPKEGEIELAHYVGAHGVKRLLAQRNHDMPAYKMFPHDVVAKNKQLFFKNKKPYAVGHIKAVI